MRHRHGPHSARERHRQLRPQPAVAGTRFIRLGVESRVVRVRVTRDAGLLRPRRAEDWWARDVTAEAYETRGNGFSFVTLNADTDGRTMRRRLPEVASEEQVLIQELNSRLPVRQMTLRRRNPRQRSTSETCGRW